MRIAIVVNTSWNIFNFRLGLINALIQKGVEVVAIAPEDSYSEKLKELGCSYFPVTMQNKGSNPFKDIGLIIQLYKIYKKARPDIIFHYTIKPNIYGSIAAKMLGIPVINNVSGLGTVFLHHNLTSFFAKLLYKFSFRFPAKVFFQNTDDKELFLKEGLVSQAKTGLLPGSGVNTEKFSPLLTRTENHEFTFLMVARLLYDKGVIEYVEAIKLIKKKEKNTKIRFQIVGAIDETANLGVTKAMVYEWVGQGLLEYYPFTDNLLTYYHQADCVVLPSYREGAPRSLLEAGACGIPLVATNVPGCKEIVVENETGFLCKVKDAKSLAVAMEKMITLSKEAYLKMSEKGRKYILENFDEKIVITHYFEAVNGILSGKDKL